MRENRTSGSMSRVGKRPGVSWSPVAACGDRFVDRVRTAPDFDSTERGSRIMRAYQFDMLRLGDVLKSLGVTEQ